jgi:hypothetical protein
MLAFRQPTLSAHGVAVKDGHLSNSFVCACGREEEAHHLDELSDAMVY